MLRGLEKEKSFIQCPKCEQKSFHPEDVINGFCQFCCDWTSPHIAIHMGYEPGVTVVHENLITKHYNVIMSSGFREFHRGLLDAALRPEMKAIPAKLVPDVRRRVCPQCKGQKFLHNTCCTTCGGSGDVVDDSAPVES